jgi:hypothetical protein
MEGKIFQKLDKIAEDITDIKVTIAKQEVNIAEHMKRSDAIELHGSILEEQFKKMQKRFFMIDGAVKFIGFLAILAAIWEVIRKP